MIEPGQIEAVKGLLKWYGCTQVKQEGASITGLIYMAPGQIEPSSYGTFVSKVSGLGSNLSTSYAKQGKFSKITVS